MTNLRSLFYFEMTPAPLTSFFFFFNDTATTEIYTLSLHDALPIFLVALSGQPDVFARNDVAVGADHRSEEHTSELQSRLHLVCRLLLEKKKQAALVTLTSHCTPQPRRQHALDCPNYQLFTSHTLPS